MSEFHPAAVAAIEELCRRYPSTPFLTLGQTVLWDEPAKAAFCRMLEIIAPEAVIVAAVHDTDYFAKLPHVGASDRKFLLVEHNDGDTRGLWSAAGELSCLFGSETVPTRALLTEHGVAFDRVARRYPGGVDALLNRETAAWGWRALVHTEPRPLIAADVNIRDIAPALREQLEWGFSHSLACLEKATPEQGRIGARILELLEAYAKQHPDGTLSGFYRSLTPTLWATVRGGGSCNLETSASLELFRFNRESAGRPRFRFVDLFLNPTTRDRAKACYNDAVRGSGIYGLDQFGAGALPFDVVIPGRGRGTLRLDDGSLYIQTEEPITLCTGCDCGSIEELAGALEDQFGANVALVGKAVALISMLAHEYIFVFHEKASGYTERTQRMNHALRESGIDLPLHPMLRLQYATWNSLATMPVTFRLPTHLAAAFGSETVPAGEFAARWEGVCAAQDALLAAYKTCQSPRDLLALLAQRDGQAWCAKLDQYNAARDVIMAIRDGNAARESEVARLHQRARDATVAASAAERQKGEAFRAELLPLLRRLGDLLETGYRRRLERANRPGKLTREEKAALAAERAQEAAEVAALREHIAAREESRNAVGAQIEALRGQARDARAAARALTRERVELERSAQANAARATLIEIEYEAELARLRGVRDAITVTRGLRYANYRPTAWWLPLVSPEGDWFNALVASATARIEEL